jgi:hypothetical protein
MKAVTAGTVLLFFQQWVTLRMTMTSPYLMVNADLSD